MAGVGCARRPRGAEDVRDLQSGRRHRRRVRPGGSSASPRQRPEPVERAHDRADRVGGDPGVERGGVELGVAEQTWITRMSMFCSSRWVAKLCRSVCGVTRLVISAMWAAAWTARLSWRVVSG